MQTVLLTISTTHRPATDLGYLLHKDPAKVQAFELPFGAAHVFYPEATEERCTVCLLLDVDPVDMVRRKGREQGFLLAQYVNDRPYVASSFMSVALSQVFGTAMGGRCKDRPELAVTPLPLSATRAILVSGLSRAAMGPLLARRCAQRRPSCGASRHRRACRADEGQRRQSCGQANDSAGACCFAGSHQAAWNEWRWILQRQFRASA